MRRLPPPAIGLLQAIGLACYVAIFGSVVSSNVLRNFGGFAYPALNIMLGLLAFCFSALTCGTIALGYPAVLLFEKKWKVAVSIVLWNILWMALFLLAVFVYIATKPF